MENLTLLEKLIDPQIMENLGIGEKLLGGLVITVLGMGVTFVILILLWCITSVMSNTIRKGEDNQEVKPVVPEIKVEKEPSAVSVEEDEELIAVITAAVAASLQTSIHNIYVKNIVRIPDTTPVWGKAARLEQINSRF
jgi:sodium pump decarboxylase gamma subunit